MAPGYKTRRRENVQRGICVFTDWLTTFVAFFCFNCFRFYYMGIASKHISLADYILSDKLIFEQITVPVALLFVYWLSGYYNHPFERSRLQEFLTTLYSQIFNTLVIYLAALTNDQLLLRRENWMLIIILFILLFSFNYMGRLVVTENMLRKLKKWDRGVKTVIVGVSEQAKKLASKLSDVNARKPGAEIVAFMPFGNEFDSPEEDRRFQDVPRLENIEDLKQLCKKNKVEDIILVPPKGKHIDKKVLYFLYNLYPYDISIKINPDIFSIITPTIRLGDILGEPFVDLTRPQMSEFFKNTKRSIDVVASAVGLVILSPLFLIAAIGVRLSGPGNIIYSQERIGLHKKPFKIYKFRSMVENAESDGNPQLSSDSDSRITKTGKWMRKYRIDELPQFWNVLKGDMSLVGPRPEREFFIDRIVKKAPWYTLVLQVRPGITSWGMVKYGYATDINQMIERNRFDLIYLSNMSVAVDFKILIHTIKTVGAGEGK